MPDRELVIDGVPISSGIVLGTTRVVLPGDVHVAETPVPASRVPDEIAALEQAVEDTLAELRLVHAAATRKMGGPVAKIFDAQLLIAGDREFLKGVFAEIEHRRMNAGYVYHTMVQRAVGPLKLSSERYMRQTAQDIESVAKKVLVRLAGGASQTKRLAPNTIVVGKSFSPNDILAFRDRKAIGFVIGEGGTESHMALIARALMLPVVLIDESWREISNDRRLIIDGGAGRVIVNPSEKIWTEYQRRRRRMGPTAISRIKRLTKIPPVTSDGMPITVGANLSLPGPADEILAAQHMPVGLYRTEFLFLTNLEFPSEEVQYDYYRRIAHTFGQTPVVLRTFDLGGDKLSNGDDFTAEENPALGLRGMRAMLVMRDEFRAQIRAILRASAFGNLRILLPMITDVSEVERAKKIISQEKFRLRKEKVKFKEDIQVGIMVEVPSAAMMTETLSSEVDFVSIGTNDLTQYTLAADRMNSHVAHLYNALHPAVLRLVHQTVRACKMNNVPVTVCGELAGDVLAVPLLIGMGVDVLSMAPARIVDVCRYIRKIDSTLVRHLVGPVTASATVQAVVDRLHDYKEALENR